MITPAGTAMTGSDLAKEIERLYRQGLTDYYMEPLVMVDADRNPVGRVQDDDAIIFCCKRGEREIQLTRSFIDPSFDEFTTRNLENLTFVTLTLYHEMFLRMPAAVAFPPLQVLDDTIGEVVSRSGLRQLRVAESEKFAHVTFFLNGNNNRVFRGEDHIRVPSIKGVPFDRVPELRSEQVAGEIIKSMQDGQHAFIVVNFANGDMIGHFENREPKIKCAEAVDRQLARVLSAAASAGYVTLITADHGILETAVTPDGIPNLSHTQKPVPLIVVDPDTNYRSAVRLRGAGTLADVAPTALQLMGLAKPELMTGQSLLRDRYAADAARKVLLVILDGWGLGKPDQTNPILLADTPVWDRLTTDFPMARLEASGKAVGLLDWKAGNSEAGHQTIGAGRTVLQDDARIELAISDGSFFKNSVFLSAFEKTQAHNGSLHLLALLSEKSSHGSISYPVALLRLAREKKLKKVFVHAIFDGRSTKVRSAVAFLEKLQREMTALGVGELASGIGRGLALDRDGDYRKTKQAYDALACGIGIKVPSAR